MQEDDRITDVLRLVQNDPRNRDHAGRLFDLVHQRMLRIAGAARRGQSLDSSLGTSTLVTDAFVKLVYQNIERINDSKHFYCLAATVTFQLVIDRVRHESRQIHGGGWHRIDNDKSGLELGDPLERDLAALVDLQEALECLERERPRWHEVFVLDFWGFMHEEIGEKLSVSVQTVGRRLKAANTFLRRKLRRSEADG